MHLVFIFAAGLAALAACTPRDPPAPTGNAAIGLPESTTSTSTSTPTPTTSPTSTADDDPALLPQTRDVPHATGRRFDARVAALWNAILHDDPESAIGFFFPLGAYEQVKDIAAPAIDWKHRLVAAYARDIHAMHARLAAGGARATFTAIDVPEARAHWVEPGEEYNKIGYFRVFGSKLRYDEDKVGHTFEIKSLISWRGEWYVVHLSAMK